MHATFMHATFMQDQVNVRRISGFFLKFLLQTSSLQSGSYFKNGNTNLFCTVNSPSYVIQGTKNFLRKIESYAR
jgi:hypothetical protein